MAFWVPLVAARRPCCPAWWAADAWTRGGSGSSGASRETGGPGCPGAGSDTCRRWGGEREGRQERTCEQARLLGSLFLHDFFLVPDNFKRETQYYSSNSNIDCAKSTNRWERKITHPEVVKMCDRVKNFCVHYSHLLGQYLFLRESVFPSLFFSVLPNSTYNRDTGDQHNHNVFFLFLSKKKSFFFEVVKSQNLPSTIASHEKKIFALERKSVISHAQNFFFFFGKGLCAL